MTTTPPRPRPKSFPPGNFAVRINGEIAKQPNGLAAVALSESVAWGLFLAACNAGGQVELLKNATVLAWLGAL